MQRRPARILSNGASARRFAYGHWMTWFDTTLMRWVAANRFPIGDQLAHGIMSLSTNLVILAVATLLGLVYVVARHRYRLAAGVVIAVVASTLIAELLKQILGRARPPASMALVHANGLSMPSTDAALTAAAATALYVGLVWVHPRARRLAGVILAAGVVALGLCLIYLGVHWPTDVFAGWALGVGVGAGTAAMITPRRWRRAGQLHHIDDRPEGAVR